MMQPDNFPVLTNPHNDWRIRLFGEFIQRNESTMDDTEQHSSSTDGDDVESVPVKTENPKKASLVATQAALDQKKFDYIAVFIGADYCPHCKAFAPTVHAAVATLRAKRCKVLFVSNDRTKDDFRASCHKNAGIDVMPYDLDKTAEMRKLFDLKTIPALIILRNTDFGASSPPFVTNARNALPADPETLRFPWEKPEATEPISLMDRLIIRGRYGRWWELGHRVNPEHPDQLYMDEHAVRIRAGLLNIIAWLAVTNVFIWRNTNFIPVVYPLVAFEFFTSANFGMSPIAPVGTIATVAAHILQPTPYWKPAKPKRFAWYIGLTLSTTCLIIFLFRDSISEEVYVPAVGAVALMCMLATWLEACAGFCIGCFVYNTMVVPLFKLEECVECKL